MKNKKMQNNKSGFVLVLTLLCAVIVSAAMMSTMFVSTKGQKIVKNFKESVQTLDAADAAVKKAKQAMTTYMTNYQIYDLGGAEGDFTQLLSTSTEDGMVIPTEGDSWGGLTIFGNTVNVTVSDNDDGDGDTTRDVDRIVLLTAEATSPTNQRVRIQATVQAPSSSNTNSGMPSITQAMFMCSDVLGRRQEFTVKRDTLVSGYDHPTLPAIFPSGTTLYDASPDYVPTGAGVPAATMVNATKQRVNIASDATVIAEIEGAAYEQDEAVLTIAEGDEDATNYCTSVFAFVDQLSLLSDSLPNVNVITASTVGTGSLGTRASPVISIINGVTTVSRGRSSKSKVTFDSGTSGAGIMLLQGETETNNTVAVLGKNFYYEGLIVVYGDDKAKLKFKKEEMMYGAAIALTGSDDANDKVKITLDKDGIFAYSSTALANANSAYGNALGIPLITETSDPRNTVITVGWYEDYDF